jgi:anti-sigma regulatory factor (Ser/Thr protein kinase)
MAITWCKTADCGYGFVSQPADNILTGGTTKGRWIDVTMPAQAASRSELDAGSHVADFYRDDEKLMARVADHLTGSLAMGGSAIAVCTPVHRRALEDALNARGFDGQRAQEEGSLVLLDADEMLQRIMADSGPDAAKFFAVVGQLVRSQSVRGRPLHVFGEMVALLWDDGRVTEAIELETLWNNLGASVCFDLYCAYHSEIVDQPGRAGDVSQVCDLHSSVIGRPPTALAAATGEIVYTQIFPAEARSASLARRFVQEALAGYDPRLVDDAVMAASELAANAVVHGGSQFVVTIAHSSSDLRLSVGDSGQGQPTLRSSDPMDPAGRGLYLVDSLATLWGVERKAQGKVVWAHFE